MYNAFGYLIMQASMNGYGLFPKYYSIPKINDDIAAARKLCHK